jgi:hypothetical protein
MFARTQHQSKHGTGLLREVYRICQPAFVEFIAAGWELRADALPSP